MSHKYFDRIEKYFSGEMSPEERQAFEAELKENADLQREFNKHTLAQDALEVAIEDDLRQSFSSWDQEWGAKGTARSLSSRKLWYRLSIAAGILIILSVSAWQWSVSQYSDQALFENYALAAEIPDIRGAGNSNILAEGLSFLRTEQYQQALSFFQTIPPESDRYTEAQYWLGVAYFNIDQFDQAQAAFQTVVDRQDIRFFEKAEWYLVLCHLGMGNTGPELQLALDDIQNQSDHGFNEEARKLEKKINSFWRNFIF